MQRRWISLAGIMLLVLSGCRDDERVVRMAQQSLETQRQQNIVIAKQSQTVVDESAKLAETARTLVDQDAKARGEILSAQRNLQDQATNIEQERGRLMELHVREPVIAEAIRALDGMLICLVPLILIGMLLWPNASHATDFEQVNELLIQELAGDSKLLLSDREKTPLISHSDNPKLPPPF